MKITLTGAVFPKMLWRMGSNEKTSKERRMNITLTGDHVAGIERLRELLENRLKQRLSIAQVMKRLYMNALEEEEQELQA